MLRVVAVIAVVALTVYCLIELVQADPLKVRVMPKWLWAGAIILLPGIGALCWMIFGRPVSGGGGGGGKDPGPIAPDDDPAFLRSLRQKTR
ncbi:MAG: PLD nuclease N-terminal domain-containing protein [Propionibacteriaceae bacterium]|jgi:hypothetical protein|nr:PLD nuclease N-terminal domain-containing protein [Propionibacteriaceae bacterium]